MIPYGRQYIDDEDIKAVLDVLKSDFLTQGPIINQFEKALAAYCGAKYAVVFNSGTSALHGAYFSLGLKKDDEFITTAMTFVATSNAGLYLGAKPVFVDIEPDTGNIDTEKIEEAITKNVKLISVVHYAGHPVNMKKVREIADKYGLKVVEDACHAIGAKYEGENVGNCKYSDATIFSFHPVKHITTGEGGVVLTNDESIYRKLLKFRSHGIVKTDFVNKPHGDWYYEMTEIGYNYRMTDIQATLGLSQLKKLDKFVKRRREIAKTYNSLFDNCELFYTPVEKDYAYHSYHLYPIRLKDRYLVKKTKIFKSLREKGLNVQVHYIPVYFHPFYQNLGYKKGICKEAEIFYKSEISLPIFYALKDEEVLKIKDILFSVMKSV